jgi:hypothetical protein
LAVAVTRALAATMSMSMVTETGTVGIGGSRVENGGGDSGNSGGGGSS